MLFLAVASVLVLPALSGGRVLGHQVTGSVAPLSVSLLAGACLFGFGMLGMLALITQALEPLGPRPQRGPPPRSGWSRVVRGPWSLAHGALALGALLAAVLSGRTPSAMRVPLRSLAAAAIGGLLMGYGARLSFGCNIGAFVAGVISTSAHGWIWFIAAGRHQAR